jgi:tetratricopeptide (TPR) repeat protein
MDPIELLKEAHLLFVKGKYKESVEVFTKAIEAGVDPYIAYLSRGAANLKAEAADEAIHDFDKALEANSQSARAYFFRGSVYLMKEEFQKAVSDFTKAQELKHDYFIALFSRGIAYARMNMNEEATKDLMTVIPQMEQNLQGFADDHGIIRTQLLKVMGQLEGDREWPILSLGDKEMDNLKKWLEQE